MRTECSKRKKGEEEKMKMVSLTVLTLFFICSRLLAQSHNHPNGDCNAHSVYCNDTCQDLLMQNEEALGYGTCANHYPVGATGHIAVPVFDCSNDYAGSSWNEMVCEGGKCAAVGQLHCFGGPQPFSLTCYPDANGEPPSMTAKKSKVQCIYSDGSGGEAKCGSNGVAEISFWTNL
jgi:hypothetical protein